MKALQKDIEYVGRLKKRSQFLAVANSGHKWVSKSVVLQIQMPIVESVEKESDSSDVDTPLLSELLPDILASQSPQSLQASAPSLAPFPICEVLYGITATKRLGNAVIRNRVKRRLRAAVKDALASDKMKSVLAQYALPFVEQSPAKHKSSPNKTGKPLGVVQQKILDRNNRNAQALKIVLIGRAETLTLSYDRLVNDVQWCLKRVLGKIKDKDT